MMATVTADVQEFRRTMGRMAKCVSVTTAMSPSGPVGCTTTGVLSLSTEPPTMLVSLTTSGSTLAHALSAGSFSVNVLAACQHDLVRQFASGEPRRRFDGVDYHVHEGAPVLADASAAVVCTVRETIAVLDHTLLIGTVRHSRAGGGSPLLLLDGTPCAVVTDLDAVVSDAER